MEVDYEKLGNVIDGCVISADDLPAMQDVSEDRDERAKLLLDKTEHIMAALAEYERILRMRRTFDTEHILDTLAACQLIISSMRRRIKAWGTT